MFNVAFTEILLGILAVLLIVAAVIDTRTFTISNGLNVAVALLAAGLLARGRARSVARHGDPAWRSRLACSRCSLWPSSSA